jgi:hypothetical protein
MPDSPVRRAHMISPFGPGAMLVAPDGTSMLAAGLDHWFEHQDGSQADDAEFHIEEWRLQRRLGVGHFRLPPDYRRRRRGQDVPNTELKLPFVRFPRWHFCPWCHTLSEEQLTPSGRRPCAECQKDGRRRYLAQVPFVAMCQAGHMQDFPWREWVHQSVSPTCTGTLKLYATGGATLANQVVSCSCGLRRTLASITQASADGSSFLSRNIQRGAEYPCGGILPQHGASTTTQCGQALRGTLRAASNVYFALVRSAIYLPSTTVKTAPDELIALIRNQADLIFRAVEAHDAGQPIEASRLRSGGFELMLRKYRDPEVEAAAAAAVEIELGARTIEVDDGQDEETEEQFRLAEAAVLDDSTDTSELTVRTTNPHDYAGITPQIFDRVNLVDRLRETRVLAGFDRVYPEQALDREHRLTQLWLNRPAESQRWLPAYCVYGEGLFFRLSESVLRRWEADEAVRERAELLQGFYETAQQHRHLRDRTLSARFILAHTLSHLLMNQLTFECGYSSAALKERLYISTEADRELCALLLYTAAGDAEGTMGGLVRMGKRGNFENVLDAALRGASWCASDPVCMEIGSATGQGPDSCNLATCHSCGLVPETACEEFNRFLDRGLVVGTPENPQLGFFPYSGWDG